MSTERKFRIVQHTKKFNVHYTVEEFVPVREWVPEGSWWQFWKGYYKTELQWKPVTYKYHDEFTIGGEDVIHSFSSSADAEQFIARYTMLDKPLVVKEIST